MIGSPQDRYAKRQALYQKIGRLNARRAVFDKVEDGTLQKFRKAMDATGWSADVLLFRMITAFNRTHT